MPSRWLGWKYRDCSEIETGTALGYIWLGSPVIGTLIHSDHKIGVALHHNTLGPLSAIAVGIGTSGALLAGTGCYTTSDARVKKDWSELSDDIGYARLEVKPLLFRYKSQPNSVPLQLGYRAQDLLRAGLPHCVNYTLTKILESKTQSLIRPASSIASITPACKDLRSNLTTDEPNNFLGSTMLLGDKIIVQGDSVFLPTKTPEGESAILEVSISDKKLAHIEDIETSS
ncbi:unnamed protein product [Phytophthora fragariaefolia]|uniref:Unnamed protein product n=1 Tax=Phytophthora fragariaefolia TaxID=1490495 RepID=A0A9W7D873_9STRA|nr:unnamed protein product [Phytophthora fragariaefolia]